jgi:hypothetical protein
MHSKTGQKTSGLSPFENRIVRILDVDCIFLLYLIYNVNADSLKNVTTIALLNLSTKTLS